MTSNNLTVRNLAFINGNYTAAVTGKVYPVHNPADGTVITEVSACDAIDVRCAAQHARAAFDDGRWSSLRPSDKKKRMLAFADLIEANAAELAALETRNTGKPIRDTETVDIPKSVNMLRWYAEAADKIYGGVAPTAPSVHAFISREPLGVIGAVIPWNFPLYLAAYKLGPALVTGNSIVIKPADQTPLSLLRVAELASLAGIPDGVLNVVPGSGESVGQALGLDPDVDALAFTGSPQVAKRFLAYAAESNMKKVMIEGGGKCANIVLADVEDLDRAAFDAAWGVFFNNGQVCSAGSRLVVEESIADQLIEKIRNLTANIRVGDPSDPATEIGAIIDERHLNNIERFVRGGESDGAILVCGGKRLLEHTGGWYFEPTIFDHARNDMDIARDEIFGPVLTVIRAGDAEEAIDIANDSQFALGAALWTQDVTKALKYAKQLRAGQVWVNNYDGSDLTVPWGGFRLSGTGRDKSLEALNEYTGSKATWIEVAR